MKDELDILKETGNIAAGHGSIALSEILSKKIKLSLPKVEILTFDEINSRLIPTKICIGVFSRVFAGFKSNVLFLLDEKSAFKLIDLCYPAGRAGEHSGLLTEIGVSLLKEVGSAVISSYIGALSMLLQTVIVPSIPTFMSGPNSQIIASVINTFSQEEFVMCAEALLEEPSEHISSRILLTLNPESIKFIQERCKKTLENLDENKA